MQWNAHVHHIDRDKESVSSVSLRSPVIYQPQRIRLLSDVNDIGELFLRWSMLRMITNTLEKDTLCEVIFSIWQLAIANNNNTVAGMMRH